MILCDRDIIALMKQGDLKIDKLRPAALQPASVDLHLGPKLIVRRGEPSSSDLFAHEMDEKAGFTIRRGDFVLAATDEYLTIPGRICGVLMGKSTRAREGLIVESAGFVDPGWQGQLTLEITNLSPKPLLLKPGMAIAQIRFEAMSGTPIRVYGQKDLGSHYQKSEGPVSAKYD